MLEEFAAMDISSCAVSVVAPCFNEEDGLEEFHRRTALACHAAVGSNYEIVLVDDGSHDRTWEIMCGLLAKNTHTIAVRLLRNHGHQLAATAGLSVACGRSVMLIDADLQDPPELLGDMLALMQEGADVVYGKRISRQGETLFKRMSAATFYRVLRWFGTVPIPTDTGDFRLMSARVVEILLAMPERHRFIRGMVSWIGGRQVPIHYERHARACGISKYPLARMLDLASDAITSFSTAPLRLATLVGLMTSGLAIILLFYTIAQWSLGGVIVGWASIMTAIAFFAGIQLLVLGILGEYLRQLVHEAKGRPLFLIDTVTTADREYQPPINFAQLSPRERRSLLSAPGGRARDLIPSQRFARPQSGCSSIGHR
jgi:glycosyltransferase involved in cell wall biosynthesis